MQDSTQQVLADAAKATPPVAVVVSEAIGAINPEKLLVWVTIAYTLLLITHHVWKNWLAPWFAEKRAARARRRRRKAFNLTLDDDDEEEGA